MKIVINLHGWNSTKDSMPIASICKEMGLKHYNFDFYLHGKNAKVEYGRTITFKDLVEQAKSELSKFENDEIYLIGHSMGGAIALIMQNMFKNITKLILVDPLYPTADPHYNGGILEMIAKRSKERSEAEVSIEKIAQDIKRIKERMNTYSLANKKNLMQLVYEFSKPEFQNYYEGLKVNKNCQWYLIVGSEDAIFNPTKMINWFEDFNPKMDICEIEGATHSPYHSNELVFEEVIKKFLSE